MTNERQINNLILEDRKRLSISGVNDVDTFDEQRVLLHTQLGLLEIRGEGMHIDLLDVESGEITMNGLIHALMYQADETHKASRSFWKRLFR